MTIGDCLLFRLLVYNGFLLLRKLNSTHVISICDCLLFGLTVTDWHKVVVYISMTHIRCLSVLVNLLDFWLLTGSMVFCNLT